MRSACCERHNTKRNPVNPDIHMELWTFGEQNRNGWSLGGYARIERCAILSLQRVLRPTGFRGLASQVKRHGNAKGTKGWTANLRHGRVKTGWQHGFGRCAWLHRVAFICSSRSLQAFAASAAGPARILTKVAKECSVEAVTVFTDRAEITRAIEVDADEEGLFDIVVTSLTDLVVADSLRYDHVCVGVA
jgi:hypothetical protein